MNKEAIKKLEGALERAAAAQTYIDDRGTLANINIHYDDWGIYELALTALIEQTKGCGGDELLPCPFCGGQPEIHSTMGGGIGVYCVKCDNKSEGIYAVSGGARFTCNEKVPQSIQQRKAVAAWNTRTTALDKLLKELSDE